MYADSVADEMLFVLEHAGVRFAVCQDQEQIDKLVTIREQLPALERLIYDEARGLARYDTETFLDFRAVQSLRATGARGRLGSGHPVA